MVVVNKPTKSVALYVFDIFDFDPISFNAQIYMRALGHVSAPDHEWVRRAMHLLQLLSRLEQMLLDISIAFQT